METKFDSRQRTQRADKFSHLDIIDEHELLCRNKGTYLTGRCSCGWEHIISNSSRSCFEELKDWWLKHVQEVRENLKKEIPDG